MQRESHQTENVCLRKADEKFSSCVFYLGSSAERSEDTETQLPSLPRAVHATSAQQDPEEKFTQWNINYIKWGFHNSLISSKSYPKLRSLSSYLPKASSYWLPLGREHHRKQWKLIVLQAPAVTHSWFINVLQPPPFRKHYFFDTTFF